MKTDFVHTIIVLHLRICSYFVLVSVISPTHKKKKSEKQKHTLLGHRPFAPQGYLQHTECKRKNAPRMTVRLKKALQQATHFFFKITRVLY
jgi:hypothetical protein